MQVRWRSRHPTYKIKAMTISGHFACKSPIILFDAEWLEQNVAKSRDPVHQWQLHEYSCRFHVRDSCRPRGTWLYLASAAHFISTCTQRQSSSHQPQITKLIKLCGHVADLKTILPCTTSISWPTKKLVAPMPNPVTTNSDDADHWNLGLNLAH